MLTKFTILPGYKGPWLLCLALPHCQKSDLILVKKSGFKIEVIKKKIVTKKVLLNFSAATCKKTLFLVQLEKFSALVKEKDLNFV